MVGRAQLAVGLLLNSQSRRLRRKHEQRTDSEMQDRSQLA